VLLSFGGGRVGRSMVPGFGACPRFCPMIKGRAWLESVSPNRAPVNSYQPLRPCGRPLGHLGASQATVRRVPRMHSGAQGLAA